MKPQVSKILAFLVFFLISFQVNLSAHPGRTASDGCHYCRTNCDRWGVPWNERHCHNSPALPSSAILTSSPKETPSNQEGRLWVFKTIDGDTLELSNGEKIRLIGVDTPETKHPSKPVEYFGKEATEFTRKQIEGREVRLEFDWQKKDKYGRTLAYVYRVDDNFFLNAEIIRQGYGHAYTRFPFKHLEDFRRYEREARENKRGLWG